MTFRFRANADILYLYDSKVHKKPLISIIVLDEGLLNLSIQPAFEVTNALTSHNDLFFIIVVHYDLKP